MSFIPLLGKQKDGGHFFLNKFEDQSVIDQVGGCKNLRCKQSQARLA